MVEHKLGLLYPLNLQSEQGKISYLEVTCPQSLMFSKQRARVCSFKIPAVLSQQVINISTQTRATHSIDFEIAQTISDQIAPHRPSSHSSISIIWRYYDL